MYSNREAGKIQTCNFNNYSQTTLSEPKRIDQRIKSIKRSKIMKILKFKMAKHKMSFNQRMEITQATKLFNKMIKKPKMGLKKNRKF